MSTKKFLKVFGLLLVVVLLAAALPLQAKAQAATVVTTEAGLLAALADTTVTEITITADISVGSVAGNVFTVSSGRTVTLDLNGHTISADTSNGGVFSNAGTLTILDNSVDKGGMIINTNTTQTEAGEVAKSAISNTGVLTVNSGVTVAGPATGHGVWGDVNFNPAYGIDNLGGGKVTVNGATISGAYGLRNFANQPGTTITITDGIVTGKTGIAMQSFGTNDGTLTINGDTIVTATRSAIYAAGVTQYNQIVINGGTFSGEDDYGTVCVVDGTLDINGGTFTGRNNTYSLINYYAIVDVTAGTFYGDIWGGDSEPYTGYEGTGSTSFATSEGDCITIDGVIEGVVSGEELVNTCHVHNVTQDTYYTTIQAAIDAQTTVAGDVIEVGPGTYTENVNINKGVTLRAVDLIETVVLSDTAAPGVWYPDRYRPAVFQSATWQGRNAIQHGVRAVDAEGRRPAGYNTQFYNTQGRKYQTSLTGAVQTMSIDVWVDASWATSQAYAGLWSTGFDAGNAISAYPIIAWRSTTGATPGFYVWDYFDTGAWVLVKAAEDGDYGKWHTLAFELRRGEGVQYYLDGQPAGALFADTGTVSLENVILNVYNYGADYDVYWDNFSTSGVSIVGQATVNASNVTFDGFKLSNPNSNFGMLVNPGFSNVTITGNTFENIGGTAFDGYVKGIYLLSGPDNVTIEGNIFRNIHANTQSVNAVYSGDSAATDAANGLIIRNNVFEDLTSATKGGYGILLNNGAGNPGVVIEGNSFNGISGGWTHAIGLEGPTENAKVENNAFAGLTATSPDNSAIFFEDNSGGGSVAVKYNKFFHSGLGVGIHPDDQPGGANNFNYTVDASPNWWGSISGPVVSTQIFGPITYDPWCGDAECSFLNPNYLEDDVTADAIQAAIDAAPAGEIIVIPAGTYNKSGGFTINNPGVTIRLADGAVIQNESLCFVVDANNVTITSETLGGGKCVPTNTSDGIVVNAGVQGLRVVGIEIDGSDTTGSRDGIHFNGAITNFQIIDNYIHDMDSDAIEFLAQPTGEPMEIQGNLFMNNANYGVNASTFNVNAQYNSWGKATGPVAGTDYTSGVTVDPWTHVDLYMLSNNQDWPNKVAKQQQISYTVYGNFQNVMGADFVLDYPETLLACLDCSDPTSGNPDPAGAFETETITVDATAGTIHYVGYNAETETDPISGTAVALFTVTFEANVVGTGALDLVETSDLFSMAPTAGSSNNIYAAALVDGEVEVIDIFDVTGIFSMQGRVFRGDIPVTLTSTTVGFPYGPFEASSLDVLGINWSVTSLPAGGYLITTNQARYLNLTSESGKTIAVNGDKQMAPLMLRGGNVVNTGTSLDKIDVSDAGLIGGVYGSSGDPSLTPADANFDGRVNILDLALVGGNYLMESATAYSGWVPLP